MAGNRVRFVADLDDNVSKKLRGISGAFDKLGGPGSGASLFGNVGAKGIAAGFNLISDAASAAIGFAFDSIDAFSRLEQATGGVTAVFGEARGSIDAFAETAAEKAGLSKAAVFEMAAVIGAKLTGMGMDVTTAAGTVVDLEQRAADMAATFGGTTVDAINAISSALTGERDPIEKYGVSIKEADVQARILALGLDTSTAAAEKQAVATATLDLIMQGTAKTTGKYADEQDTLAGKQSTANAKLENAQAILGEKLAPILTNLTSFMITDIIPAIEALGRGWEKFTGFVNHLITRLGVAIQQAKDVIAWIKKVIDMVPRIGQVTYPQGRYPQGHAEGGWVGLHGPEIGLLGEDGPEYIIPNDQLVRGDPPVPSMPGTGPATGGGTGGAPVTLQVVLDGRVVGELLDERLFVQLRRAGA